MLPTVGLDLATLEPEQLAAYAHAAFVLGLRDGMMRTTPTDGRALMIELLPPGTAYRVYHRRKFRQVYGAAFDMAQASARLTDG